MIPLGAMKDKYGTKQIQYVLFFCISNLQFWRERWNFFPINPLTLQILLLPGFFFQSFGIKHRAKASKYDQQRCRFGFYSVGYLCQSIHDDKKNFKCPTLFSNPGFENRGSELSAITIDIKWSVYDSDRERQKGAMFAFYYCYFGSAHFPRILKGGNGHS